MESREASRVSWMSMDELCHFSKEAGMMKLKAFDCFSLERLLVQLCLAFSGLAQPISMMMAWAAMIHWIFEERHEASSYLTMIPRVLVFYDCQELSGVWVLVLQLKFSASIF